MDIFATVFSFYSLISPKKVMAEHSPKLDSKTLWEAKNHHFKPVMAN